MKDSTRLVSFRSDSDDGWSTPECINGSRFMSRGACLFPFIGAREPPKIHSLLLINAPNRYFMRNKYDVRGPLRGPSLSKRKLWNKYLSLSLSLSLSLLFLFLPFLLETKLVWRTLRQELTFLSPPYRMVKNAYRASSLSFFRV